MCLIPYFIIFLLPLIGCRPVLKCYFFVFLMQIYDEIFNITNISSKKCNYLHFINIKTPSRLSLFTFVYFLRVVFAARTAFATRRCVFARARSSAMPCVRPSSYPARYARQYTAKHIIAQRIRANTSTIVTIP